MRHLERALHVRLAELAPSSAIMDDPGMFRDSTFIDQGSVASMAFRTLTSWSIGSECFHLLATQDIGVHALPFNLGLAPPHLPRLV
jgi:hypothetical protein